MDTILSVIVPVFNSQPYLKDCVESILASGFSGLELLLVDDGSTDGSSALIDGYCTLDSRVSAFHKPNGGVSSARNLGLEKARGEWVVFVDADDFVSKGYFEGLLSAAKDRIDFVHGGCTDWTSEGGKKVNSRFADEVGGNPREILKAMEGYAVSKLYRLSIIRSHALKFDERMDICEDMAFTYSYLPFISAYATVSECGYFYRRDNAAGALNSEPRDFERRIKNFRYLMESYDSALSSLGLGYGDAPKQSAHKAAYIMSAAFILYGSGLDSSRRIEILKATLTATDREIIRYYVSSPLKRLLSRILSKGYYSLFDFLASASIKTAGILRKPAAN